MTLWPQITQIVLTLLFVGRAITRYGELKKSDRYDLGDILIGPALGTTILYYGGFYDRLLAHFFQ